ncbi:transcriptional regulator with XRE-family HTH domain [Streptomyces sp. TE3672]
MRCVPPGEKGPDHVVRTRASSSEDVGNSAPEPIAFGQRMQVLRSRRGMSRPVRAGMVGRSPSWVKQVEGGQLQMPKLPMVLRIAEALCVGDLAELTGDQSRPAVLFAGSGHARLAQVRAAIDGYPFTSTYETPSASYLEARLTHAWRARHAAANHREVIGALLPALIRDAQLAVRQCETSAERRAAQALLSQAYSLSQFSLAYQADGSLLWRVVERGMVAAMESEAPTHRGRLACRSGPSGQRAGAFRRGRCCDHGNSRSPGAAAD